VTILKFEGLFFIFLKEDFKGLLCLFVTCLKWLDIWYLYNH